jgi:hypothetical protein
MGYVQKPSDSFNAMMAHVYVSLLNAYALTPNYNFATSIVELRDLNPYSWNDKDVRR